MKQSSINVLTLSRSLVSDATASCLEQHGRHNADLNHAQTEAKQTLWRQQYKISKTGTVSDILIKIKPVTYYW